MRKSQAEALALAEAVRSRNETAELREALERAEAAEAENRRMVERMRMANDAAGLSVWEWDIKPGRHAHRRRAARSSSGSAAQREFKGTDYREHVRAPGRSRGLGRAFHATR